MINLRLDQFYAEEKVAIVVWFGGVFLWIAGIFNYDQALMATGLAIMAMMQGNLNKNSMSDMFEQCSEKHNALARAHTDLEDTHNRLAASHCNLLKAYDDLVVALDKRGFDLNDRDSG